LLRRGCDGRRGWELDRFGGDFEGADVAGGDFVDSGAEEVAIAGERIAGVGHSDSRVEGEAGGEHLLEVGFAGVDVESGGDRAGDDEPVVAITDGDKLEGVAIGAVRGPGELEASRVDPVVNLVVAVWDVAKEWRTGVT
jgi:hypothetical protein